MSKSRSDGTGMGENITKNNSPKFVIRSNLRHWDGCQLICM